MCHHPSSWDPHCLIIRAQVVHLTTLSLPSSEKPYASVFSFFSGTHAEPTSIPHPTPPLNIILYQRPSTSYMAITKQTKMLGNTASAPHLYDNAWSFISPIIHRGHAFWGSLQNSQRAWYVCRESHTSRGSPPLSPSCLPASPYSVVFDQHSCPDTRSASEPVNPNAAPMPEWQPCLPSLLIHTIT